MIFNRINTLANRLTLSYASAFIVLLFAVFGVAYLSLTTLLNARMAEDLEEDLRELQIAYTQGGIQQTLDDIDNELRSGDATEIFFRVIDNGNEVYLSDMTEWDRLLDTLNSLPLSDLPALRTINIESQDYPTQIIMGYLTDGGPLITLGESTEPNAEVLEILLALFFAMALAVIPLAYFVGWWVSQRAVAGINTVSRAAMDIERGQLDRQVSVVGAGQEIEVLGRRFNTMADRIRQLVNEMRDMIDNIAHDLRSPVTRIRATAETVATSADCQVGARKIMHECDELIQLINTTLDVSEVEAGVFQGEKQTVDLGQLTHDVCELFEPAMEEHQLALECDIHPASIIGFGAYLQRVIANLLDNAIKYTPKGGKVFVGVHNGGDQTELIVEDSGPGIATKDIDRIFDRFYRGDQARQERGSGLGLSFCRAVVRAHQGTINVVSEANKGSRFILTFPASN